MEDVVVDDGDEGEERINGEEEEEKKVSSRRDAKERPGLPASVAATVPDLLPKSTFRKSMRGKGMNEESAMVSYLKICPHVAEEFGKWTSCCADVAAVDVLPTTEIEIRQTFLCPSRD